MSTVNERLRDALIARQVGIQRLASRQVKRALEMLIELEKRLAADLRRRILEARILGFDTGPFTTLRLRRQLAEVRALMAEAYRAIGVRMASELKQLAAAEQDYLVRMLENNVPQSLQLGYGLVPLTVWAEIVDDTAFQGGLLSEYFAATGRNSLVAQAMRRYESELREMIAQGIIAGEPVDKVVRLLMQQTKGISRAHLRTIVDTATKHTMNTAREKFFDANAGKDGVIKAYQWLSTLDLRTTIEFCIPRDGKAYTVDKEPIGHSYEWGEGPGRIHYNCRSGQTSVLKSWKELGIDADEIDGRTRASMDGQVSDKVTWAEWAAQREWTPEELEEMLGKERARRVILGDISFSDALREVGLPGRLVENVSLSLDSQSVLRWFESGVRSEGAENFLAISSDGSILGHGVGTRTAVTLPREMLESLQGGIITHNHPNGAPFSPQDIQAAIKHSLGEMRAITETRTYVMRPGELGWPGLSQLRNELTPFLLEYERLKAAGTFGSDLEKIEWVNAMWRSLAASLGMSYARF